LEREEFCVYNQSLDYSNLHSLIDKIINNLPTQRQKLDKKIKQLETGYRDAISNAVSMETPAIARVH